MPILKLVNEMCDYTESVGDREFICVLPFHGSRYDKNGRKMPKNDSRGKPSAWRKHLMMRRYPIGDH